MQIDDKVEEEKGGDQDPQIIDNNEVKINGLEPEPQCFKTSNVEQTKDLKEYMQEQLNNPFNNYCIDCKKNKTSHSIVHLGAFVCGECAEAFKVNSGGNQHCCRGRKVI